MKRLKAIVLSIQGKIGRRKEKDGIDGYKEEQTFS